MERLARAWPGVQRRRVEDAVAFILKDRPHGVGLSENVLERVARDVMERHAREPKENPIGYLITVARQAIVQPPAPPPMVEEPERSGWTGFPAGDGDGLRPLATMLEKAQELPVPPVTTELERAERQCDICAGGGFLRTDWPLGHRKFGQTVPCQCSYSNLTERLLKYAGFDDALGHTFDRIERLSGLEEAIVAAERFVEGEPAQLVLTGVTGCGKTHLAVAIAHGLIERGDPVRFVNVPRHLDVLRGSYDQDNADNFDLLLRSLMTVPVLILDDLAAERGTAWAREKLYEIVDARYAGRLRTVATSNHQPEQWDQRVLSRLCDWQRSTVVAITAGDYRLRNVQFARART
jgi:DNA replication protein DnaC